MKSDRESPLVVGLGWLMPSVVGGSGVLNLLSLMRVPRYIRQSTWLRLAFPLDFTRLHPSATLLLGFTVVLTAIHLMGRKRRALRMAVALALASGFYHATTAWNPVRALGSVVVAGVLLADRRRFPVGSARPDLSLAVKRAAIAVAVAGAYGAIGFWLLKPHHFGQNFHWWEAVARTLQVMLLVVDPGLSPQTPYAARFLESLYLISAGAFLYCGVTLFRPVTYRLRRDEGELGVVQRIAAEHGRSGQDFFKQWPDKSFFFSPGRRCFLAYRVANHFALVLGDPVGPEEELQATVERFAEFCQRRGWRVGFHQVQPDRLGMYEAAGFRHLKIGDDAVVELGSFTLQGSAMKEFRNTVNRLERLGYTVQRFDPQIDGELLGELKAVSDEWLAIPGHRERQFTLGRFDEGYVASTCVYAAMDEKGEVAAFTNLVPSYQNGLATVDLMRRRQDSVNGVMDYLFARMLLALKAEGMERFSLGMVPGIGPGEQGTAVERAVDWALRNFPRLFRAESLRRFKAKYADSWEPRYTIYRSRWDLPRLALALKKISEDGEELRSAA